MKRFFAMLVMASVLGALLSCIGQKVKTEDPMATLRKVRDTAAQLKTIWAPEIIRAIDLVGADPELKADEKATASLAKARAIAVRFGQNIEPVAELVAGLATLDAANKEDLKAKLEIIRRDWQELEPLLDEVNQWAMQKFKDNAFVRTAIQLYPSAVSIGLGYLELKLTS